MSVNLQYEHAIQHAHKSTQFCRQRNVGMLMTTTAIVTIYKDHRCGNYGNHKQLFHPPVHYKDLSYSMRSEKKQKTVILT